jgi:TonB family protein
MTSERTLDWVDGLVHGLIHHAARRAPDLLSERLEEEWLADLAERCGRISRLRFAVGCCWATSVIAHDHGAAALPATSSPVGHALLGYAHADYPRLFSRRTITFLLVAGLHAAVLYGLAIGLTSKYVKVLSTPPFVARVLERPRSDLPPPPQPQVSHTRIEVPISEMPQVESEPGDGVEPTPQEPQRSELSASVPTPVKRVQGKPDAGFPSADDFYPPAAIRMGEKGSATVRACVDAKGRLISEPTIVESTGSPRLDEGALKLAKAGSGHYRATTEDGRPVNSCYPFRIRFELRN